MRVANTWSESRAQRTTTLSQSSFSRPTPILAWRTSTGITLMPGRRREATYSVTSVPWTNGPSGEVGVASSTMMKTRPKRLNSALSCGGRSHKARTLAIGSSGEDRCQARLELSKKVASGVGCYSRLTRNAIGPCRPCESTVHRERCFGQFSMGVLSANRGEVFVLLRVADDLQMVCQTIG